MMLRTMSQMECILKPYNAIFKKQSFGKKQSFDQTSSYLWAFQAPGVYGIVCSKLVYKLSLSTITSALVFKVRACLQL